MVAIVHKLARVRPEAVALSFSEGVHTFAKLWAAGLTVADALLEAGVGPGDLVGLWADRTPAVLAAALGVMVAGAAYVPLDPTYPQARIEAVLQAAELNTLLFDRSTPISPPCGTGFTSLDISTMQGNSSAHVGHTLPQGSDAAYVIFTSGSTGRPKGVVVEHGSLLNYSAWCAALFKTGGTPLFGSLGFDHTITSLWPTLIRGETVHLFGGAWDANNLFRERERHFASIKVTPSHLRFFERTVGPDYRRVTGTLISGGEPLETALIRAAGARLDGVRLINHFGPTETTVGCCYFAFDNRAPLPDTPTVPIGRPIWNTRAYVVDADLAPVAAGEPGELVIAGAGVARGYLGAPSRTQRFIDEKELGGRAGRAYQTGDRVRLLPDGNLLHMGRLDDQEKINGYRIEIGELRFHAMTVPGVEDIAFEIVRGSVDIVEAFVVPMAGVRDHEGEQEFSSRLRQELAAVLPQSVVPRRIYVVPNIAVNVHGKRDLRATRRGLSASL
ncbi:amino acid adenylation domain-containing protein [Streptomyces sp. NPDC094038]|uniref:amino acid adenylation domain-containing protein n=1 Tax=Streptomyces sp. NPDC094038 TaxID=3366055 RepID=UPI0037FFA7A4